MNETHPEKAAHRLCPLSTYRQTLDSQLEQPQAVLCRLRR